MRGDISGMSPRERVTVQCLPFLQRARAEPQRSPSPSGSSTAGGHVPDARGDWISSRASTASTGEIIDGPKLMDLGRAKLLFAACRATLATRASGTATAAVRLGRRAIANAVMKVETKARRRATLAILGLAPGRARWTPSPPRPRSRVAAPSSDHPRDGRRVDVGGRPRACTTCATCRARRSAHHARHRRTRDGRGRSVVARCAQAEATTAGRDRAVGHGARRRGRHLLPGAQPARRGRRTIETAIVTAAHRPAARGRRGDASRSVVWTVLRRAYAKITGASSPMPRAGAPRRGRRPRQHRRPAPTGTDGPAREPLRSDDGEGADPAGYGPTAPRRGSRARRSPRTASCATSPATRESQRSRVAAPTRRCTAPGSLRRASSSPAPSPRGCRRARSRDAGPPARAEPHRAPLLYAPPRRRTARAA